MIYLFYLFLLLLMKWFLLGVLFTVLVVTGVYFYLNYTQDFTFSMGAGTEDVAMQDMRSGAKASLDSIKSDLMDIKMMLNTQWSTNLVPSANAVTGTDMTTGTTVININ